MDSSEYAHATAQSKHLTGRRKDPSTAKGYLFLKMLRIRPLRIKYVYIIESGLSKTNDLRFAWKRETDMFHAMADVTATIRELRTDFRSVKRKIEEHGEIVITDNGAPAYVLKALARTPTQSSELPDYYSRMLKRQPKAMSGEETREFWKDERGER